MKIVVDLTALADNFSGMERYALNLVQELLEQNKGHQYLLIFKDEIHSAFKKYESCSFVEMMILPRKNKLWFYQVTLYRAMRKLEADMFFFPAFPSPFFLRKDGIVNTIFDMGCWDCPDTMTRKMVWYFRLMYRNAARHSQYIVTISQFSKNRILEILKVDWRKILVVSCGVSEKFYQESSSDWNSIKEKYKLPENYLLCLSTLEPRKNLRLLIESYSELVEQNRIECDLVLAGRKGWKMDEMFNGISKTTVQRIHTTGYVEDQDLPTLYARAKLFVFPSIYEGFGIPPLEAMACGVPVLCSDIEVLQEVLDGHAEYFISNDKESLKNSLVRCLDKKHCFPSSEELIAYSRKYSYASSAEMLIKF